MEQFFIVIAALIHFYIFALESLLWGKARTNKIFGVSAAEAEQTKVFAFNQGFYNLFLALGAVASVGLTLMGSVLFAFSLEVFVCLSMLGAALVLWASKPKLIRAVLVQGLAPLIALIFLALNFI